jgi:5-oxoprolinase (ATP-hydrolysing)
MSFRFAIDRGGTFTDVFAELPDGTSRILKLLSVDPANYADAPTEGIRLIVEQFTGKPIPRGVPVPSDGIEWIRMGTTVATNALLERRGARVVLVTTRGFGDVLVIGDQTRNDIFDLTMRKSRVLYERVIELDHRVTAEPEERFVEEKAPDLEQLTRDLQQAFDAGIHSVAICLLHSYAFDAHEKLVAGVCRTVGFTHISVSCELVPMVRLERRASTVCADAYLSPLITDYVAQFKRGFADQLAGVKVSFIMSDGGLCSTETFSGYKAILSGPAGGVVGYSQVLTRIMHLSFFFNFFSRLTVTRGRLLDSTWGARAQMCRASRAVWRTTTAPQLPA